MNSRILFACLISLCIVSFQLLGASGPIKLHAFEIKTGVGTIRVFFPGDPVRDQQILYSLKLSPKGRNDRRRSRNLEKLTKYSFSVQDTRHPVEHGRHMLDIGTDAHTIEIVVRDPRKRIVFQRSLKVFAKAPVLPSFVPAMLRKGYREVIIHPVQPSMDEIQVQIEEQAAEVLAASARTIHLETPDLEPGRKSMDVTGTDPGLQREVNIVDFTMTAGKTSLLRGQTTKIDLSVEGLEGMDEPVTISLTNASASTVELQGGDQQTISIDPGSDAWTGSVQVRSLRDGDFVVRGDLLQPIPEDMAGAHYTDCNLNGQAFILPPEVCYQLSAGLASSRPTTPRPATIPEWNYTDIDARQYPHDTLRIPISSNDPSVVFMAVAFWDVLTETVDTIYYDTTAHDGWEVELMPGLPNSLYRGNVELYYGQNATSAQSIYWYVGENIHELSITNGDIERLRGDEEDLLGEIDDLRRRIRRREARAREEDANASDDELEGWKDEGVARELAGIDEVLDGVENAYSDRLRAVLDSLMVFNKAVPQLPDTAALRDRYEALEEALEVCNDQLKKMEKEQEELKNAIPDIESRQKSTYKEIIALYRGTGYNYMGRSSRDDQGNFNYRYGVIVGEKYYKGSVPAEIASEVTDLEKELQALAQQHKDSRERLKELPSKIASKSKECQDLADALDQVRKALEEGIAHSEANAALHAEREEYCRQIHDLLEPLKEWCESRDDMEGMLRAIEEFMERCPSDTLALVRFWSEYNHIIQRKKNIEEQHIDRAQRHRGDADNHRDNADAARDDAAELRDALAGLYDKLDETRRAREAAVAAERKRRRELARQRKSACEDILKKQGIDPQVDMEKLKDLEEIKDEMQEISGMINDALRTAEGMSDSKAGEIAGKLSDELEKLMEPLDKYDEMKSDVEEIMEWKERLEILLDPDDSPKARAEKFGAWLEGIESVLDDVSEKFPILQFFTSYFSFLVEGYNAALNGTQAILRNRYGEVVQSGIDRVSCDALIDEYTKEGSEEAVCQLVFDKLDMRYYDYRGEWNRALIDEAVCKETMAKLLDCCIDKVR